MKKQGHHKSFLAGLLFLTAFVANCKYPDGDSLHTNAQEQLNQLNKMESRISELEKEVNTLREDNVNLSQRLDEAEIEIDNLLNANARAAAMANTAARDIEVLYCEVCDILGNPYNYHQYLQCRYGKPLCVPYAVNYRGDFICDSPKD